MKNISLILILFFLFQGIEIHSQNITITGKVVAFKGFPINGAKVTSKKTGKTVLTDSEGKFEISCNKKDALSFDAAGFLGQSTKTKSTDSLFVNLIYINTLSAYNDVINNFHLKQETLDHCIANLIDDNNNYEQMSNIFQLVQYIYPGARVATDDENGGKQQILLESRGPNTLFASPYALLVIDGIVVSDISYIRPSEVKSVKVLVGTNAGHWGVRGGNGVVEIELKKGI